MHPLPHVEEIDLSIHIEQNDRRIAYFRQAENGLYARMAILEEVIKEKENYIKIIQEY
jgi:aspartate carbamoyltransferase catalytic subunit